MARTDYIQPDPIKPLGGDQQQVVRGSANSLRKRMQATPGVGYKQQAVNLGNNIVNTTANTGKSLLSGIDATRDFMSQSSHGMKLNQQPGANTQNDLARLGDNLQGLGGAVVNGVESFGRTITQPFEQGGVINNLGRDIGGAVYDAAHSDPSLNQQPSLGSIPSVDNPISNGVNSTSPTVGSPSSQEAHQKIVSKHQLGQSTENTSQPQTNEYRDATIGDDGTSVSFGGGKGSVSGLNPEQAARIQKSLALGNQVGGFNMDNMVNATKSDADGKIMESMRNGDISADKASALMNRDFRASDRMDRLGGNADSYIKPDASPTDIKSAMAYGQNLNNFTRNGELSKRQALVAQRSYTKSLAGYKGGDKAESPEMKKSKLALVNSETELNKARANAQSTGKKFKPAFNDEFISTVPEEYRNNANLTSNDSIMELRKNISKLGSIEDIDAEINEFANDAQLPFETIKAYIQGNM